MKHLKLIWNELCFRVSRLQISIYKIFWPKKAHLIKREGERSLLVDQLIRSIEVDTGYRKISSRRGKSFADNSKSVMAKRNFLHDIQNCEIEDFEEIATKWMKKMKAIK